MGRCRFSALLVAAMTLAAGVSTLSAQESAADFPSRNIDLIVPFPAGGTADIIARFAAQGVSEAWNRPIVLQNKAGATGAIASEFVANAPGDGYTLLLATSSTHTVNAAFRKDLPFDPVKHFAPVTLFVVVPNVLVINPNKVPVHTVAEFIAHLKANPGKLNFGSSGIGGTSHFAGELFSLMTGTKMTHVPYRGSAPALNDLVAGNIDLVIDNISTVWPQVQQGRLRALGIANPQRSPLAPGVPAIAETVPGYEAVSWNGLVAPIATPEPIVRKLSQAFGAAMRKPDVVKKIEELGSTVAPNTPDEFKTFIDEDLARWVRVARESNLTSK
jgi:tripartite-type tricarboxylate transporter receptor subunit TctC